jgi:hypothetical protein
MNVVIVPPSPYAEGFNAYCDGAQLEQMPTNAHRRGWWAALEAEVAADIAAHYAKQPKEIDYAAELEDYREWNADNNYWRTEL